MPSRFHLLPRRGARAATKGARRRWRPAAEPLEPRALLASLSVGPNVDVTHALHNQAQPSIAVNPTDPQNLVVTAETPDDLGFYASVSMDGGQTWNGQVVADGTSLPAAFGNATAAFDAFGNLLIGYLSQDASSVQVVLSTDGGLTLKPLATINGIGFDPRLVVGPGGAVAPQSVWIEATNLSSNAVVATGAPITGPGQVGSFITPEAITGSAGGGFGTPSIGPNGQFLAVYQSPDNGPGPSELFSATDPDGLGPAPIGAPVDIIAVNIGGSTPTTPQPVAHINDAVGVAYDDSNGPHKGRAYLIKTDTQPLGNPNTALFLQTSDDDGKTWSQDVEVDDSGGNSTLMLPRIAVDPLTGVVGITWLDARNDSSDKNVEEFGTISLDGGATFLKNVQIASGSSNAIRAIGLQGGDDSGIDFGQYTGLAFYNDVLYPAWPDDSVSLAGNPDPNSFDIATAAVTVVGGPPPVGGLNAKAVNFGAAEGQAFSGVVATFTTNVPNPNGPPFLASIDWGDGTSASGTVTPNGLGGFNVTGTHTFGEGGKYTFRVVVSQQGLLPSSVTGTATVSDAPLSGTPVTLGLQEGGAFSGVVASFTDADPSPTVAGDYTATIDWGDGTTSAGAVAAAPGGGFQVSGSHSFPAGKDPITVTIRDAGGAVVVVKSTANVADSLLEATGQDITAIEGVPFSGQVATFTDADPRLLTSSYYTATIDWGDGTTSAGTITALAAGSVSPGGGPIIKLATRNRFGVNGTHLFRIGTHPITVTIHDGDVSQATATGTATASDAPLLAQPTTINLMAGQTFNGVVGAFTDSDPLSRGNTFTATIDWGDGTTGVGRVSYEGDHQFTVVGSHAFRPGTHNFTVTIHEVGQPGVQLDLPGTAQVSPAPISAHGAASLSGVEGVPLSAVVATFTDADPLAQAGDYSATIDWGDGTTSAGTVTAAPGGGFEVVGVHAYQVQGSDAIGVTIQSNAGPVTTANTTATIGDAPLTARGTTIAATEGTPFTGVVATFVDANPNGQAGEDSATISWGDGSSSPGTIAAGPGGFTVTGTHSYSPGGTYQITVSISSTGGSAATATSTAQVADRTFALIGLLSPLSDSGASHADGITNIRQPVFIGVTGPGSTVHLFALPVGGVAPLPIGQGAADASGNWSVTTTVPLPDGAYSIFAAATNVAGRFDTPLVQLLPAAGRGPLVIDTAGPKVASAALDPRTGKGRLTFQDGLGGLDPAALANPLNASLAAMSATGATTPLLLTGLTVAPTTPASVAAVTLTFNGGRRLRAGSYVLTLTSAGLTDLAGNALDERFFVAFPSPGNPPGNNYVAQFTTDGRSVAPPQQFAPPAERRAANNFLRRRFRFR
jgi:hypothetical protein